MRSRQDRGATAVELAMALPIFLVLVLGIVELARFVAATNALNAATREAARYGSSVGDSVNLVPRFTDCDEIRAAAIRFDGSLTPADISVAFDSGPGTAQKAACPAGGPSLNPALIDAGDRIEIVAQRSFTFTVPLIGNLIEAGAGGPITIQSTDRRTIFR